MKSGTFIEVVLLIVAYFLLLNGFSAFRSATSDFDSGFFVTFGVILMVVGGLILFYVYRRRKRAVPPPPQKNTRLLIFVLPFVFIGLASIGDVYSAATHKQQVATVEYTIQYTGDSTISPEGPFLEPLVTKCLHIYNHNMSHSDAHVQIILSAANGLVKRGCDYGALHQRIVVDSYTVYGNTTNHPRLNGWQEFEYQIQHSTDQYQIERNKTAAPISINLQEIGVNNYDVETKVHSVNNTNLNLVYNGTHWLIQK